MKPWKLEVSLPQQGIANQRGDSYAIVINKITGEGLSKLIEERQLRLIEISTILSQVFYYLLVAHEEAILNLDIKMANIIADIKSFEFALSVIIDWELSRKLVWEKG